MAGRQQLSQPLSCFAAGDKLCSYHALLLEQAA